MDTTMTFCDSVATCMNKTAATRLPCVTVTETNWLDVTIVGLVCLAFAVVAVYAIYRFFKWKDDERKAQNESHGKSDGNSGSNNKVKAEYISKLLKHLESLAIKEDKDKYDEKGSERYIKELKSLILKGTVTDEEQKS